VINKLPSTLLYLSSLLARGLPSSISILLILLLHRILRLYDLLLLPHACISITVKRIWFFSTAPQSSIEYVCEILPAKTRNPGDLALEEDGLGNKEFNTRHKGWEGYDFAYKILSVYRIENPITLNDLRNDHGMESAPRGLVYVPSSLLESVEWQRQSKLR
jgi:hypothetical protein